MGSTGRLADVNWLEVASRHLANRDKGIRARLLAALVPLARPRVAFVVALAVYLLRAGLLPPHLQATSTGYFTLLADAFLHGQLHLRIQPTNVADLVWYDERYYLYWAPFPALVIAPLVALFGVMVSDVAYTAVLAAITVALVAKLLGALDEAGVAPLTVERRAILVGTMAFGSVLLILAPVGRVWHTAQIVGWGCVLLATIAALTRGGKSGYFLVGLALAGALATRNGMLFNGVWLAYYLLKRDWRDSWDRRVGAILCGLAPIMVTLLLLGWYNWSRFGDPFDVGLQWHRVSDLYRTDFERYGVFNLRYLPTNLYYQFIAYTAFTPRQWLGGSIFWMTPVLLGAPYALWRERHRPLTWMLALSCLLIYIPIGLLMGTGAITFGPRYLLDLTVPLLVLTAQGIRSWRSTVLLVLMLTSCLTYLGGSLMWALLVY